MRIRFWCRLLLFLFTVPGFAQGGAQGFLRTSQDPGTPEVRENDEARMLMRQVILGGTGEVLKSRSQVIRQRQYPHRVQYRVETRGGFLYLIFLNERDGQFPLAGSGNTVIRRSLQDGAFQQIKIFYRDHPGCFVRVFPLGDRSSMEVYLFDKRISREVILPASFESLLLAPFSRIVRLSGRSLDWSLLRHEGDPDSDRRMLELLRDLRESLPALRDAEDGALDADGRLVQIRDLLPQEGTGGLNCSGFAKWVADGFYRPLTGELLTVDDLKTRHLETRGNRWSSRFEEERDPYFGLDWSRNLGVRLVEARSGVRTSGPEEADVRRVQFLQYVEDVGYRVEDLELAMFVQAVREPGGLYIGSINNEIGENPVLRQHFHLVVLVPFFLPGGAFRVAVLERNQETGLSSLLRRYPGHFVHLVRLDGSGDFRPPLMP